MFTKWQHLHLGTESNISIWAKDCCVITDTVVKKVAISTFWYRAKDCCAIPDTVVRKTGTETKTNTVILLIQLLRNSRHLHLGTEPKRRRRC